MKNIIIAAAISGTMAWGNAEAAQQFVSQASYRSELANRGLFGQDGVPYVEVKTFTDSYGSWTLDAIPARAAAAGYGASVFVGSDPHDFATVLTCAQPISPCAGANIVTFQLSSPVTAISGWLSYSASIFQSLTTGGADFFDNALLQNASIAAGGLPYRYTGFWGMIFDAPTDTLTFNWLTPQADDGAVFILIPVPEPAAAVLMITGLFGLVYGRSVRRPAARLR